MRRTASGMVSILLVSLLILAFGTPLVSAYMYTDLDYLYTHMDEFIDMEIITTGTVWYDFVKIPEQPGDALLQAPGGRGMFVVFHSFFPPPSEGSNITVYGVFVYVDEPAMYGYVIYVQHWEFGQYWNPYDINNDLTVDDLDVALVADAYGSLPSDSNWNPFCDVAEPYRIINIFDVVTIVGSYGEEYNP